MKNRKFLKLLIRFQRKEIYHLKDQYQFICKNILKFLIQMKLYSKIKANFKFPKLR